MRDHRSRPCAVRLVPGAATHQRRREDREGSRDRREQAHVERVDEREHAAVSDRGGEHGDAADAGEAAADHQALPGGPTTGCSAANDVSSLWRIFPVETSLGIATKVPPSPGSSRATRLVTSSSPAQPTGPLRVGQRPGALVAIEPHGAALGGVQHRGDVVLAVGDLGEEVRRLRRPEPVGRGVLQRERRRRLVRGARRPPADEAGEHDGARHERQQPDARAEDRVVARRPRPRVAGRRGVHVEAGADRDRRARRERARGDGDRGAVDLGLAAVGLADPDGALDGPRRDRQVHDQPRLLDRLLPAARDEVPVELGRLGAVARLQHSVDPVVDGVGVDAGVERDVLAADAGDAVAAAALLEHRDLVLGPVAGDLDVARDAAGVRARWGRRRPRSGRCRASRSRGS